MGNELRRVLIVFDGTPVGDRVAAITNEETNRLVKFVKKTGLTEIHLLQRECPEMPEANCQEPTAENWRNFVAQVNTNEHTTVFSIITGHGAIDRNGQNGKVGQLYVQSADADGFIKGEEVAAILGQIPAASQRAIVLLQCFAGGFRTYGLVDDNDLLISFSGTNETNQVDASFLAFTSPLPPPEGHWPTGTREDDIYTFAEMFAEARRTIYNRMEPNDRHFVFLRGKNYVDRGFGTEAAPSPFSEHPIDIQTIPSFLERQAYGMRHGITVAGFYYDETVRQELIRLAKQYQGNVQFLLVSDPVSAILKPELRLQYGQPALRIFYHGADFSQPHSIAKLAESLEAIFRGE